jgi:hypothetical protein
MEDGPVKQPIVEVVRSRNAARLLSSLVVAFCCLWGGVCSAQQRASYLEGQDVSPAFEGWEQNEDGSFNIVFGYMNRNWEEHVNIPLGEDNFISPGPADQGQPTHFLPRRNRFIFKVRVPADFGDRELAWTLRRGESTEVAYGSLARDYKIDNIVIMSETGALGAGSSDETLRANKPPTIEFEGPVARSVRVGEPLTLTAIVTDDGVPRPSGGGAGAGGEDRPQLTPQQLLERALTPPRRITVGKSRGLYLSWFVYRGAGESVSFDPAQVKTWEDTRAFANSPWGQFWTAPSAPEANRWVTNITFGEPGVYVLRGRADDGGLFDDVQVTVNVVR